MHLKTRNVNSAFTYFVDFFKYGGEMGGFNLVVDKPSRNGPVRMIEEPVILTYEKPLERVLFNQQRDCNCFFQAFEALWMLAGRNDVAPLTYFNANMANYSDNGQIFNGAYGYRWRRAKVLPGVNAEDIDELYVEYATKDQLQTIINHLKKNPESRRAVLQMWDVEDDLLKIDSTKDNCCNLSVCFSIHTGTHPDAVGDYPEAGTPSVQFLDMTVFNRSNDLIWGCLGANYVHFSFLQEYMAACIGVKVGVYNQISNNLHVYTDKFEPDKWLSDDVPDFYTHTRSFPIFHSTDGAYVKGDAYRWNENDKHFPLVQDPQVFDSEVKVFINKKEDGIYKEPFLAKVASPMCLAFRHHRERDYTKALEAVAMIEALDWQFVAREWILKRQTMYLSKKES